MWAGSKEEAVHWARRWAGAGLSTRHSRQLSVGRAVGWPGAVKTVVTMVSLKAVGPLLVSM
jgi:hypothetical protein